MSSSPHTRRARRANLRRLAGADAHDRFALRDALVTDPDAGVRTATLLRLDDPSARALLPYVRDATRDRSMLVREAAFVALGRAGDGDSLERAALACQFDRGFRVRRMALLFAARTCGADALALLWLASRDPFWRVRVAARRAAAAIGVVLAPHALEVEHEVRLPFQLDDPDPAVVTARLARVRGRVDPRALVSVLGHSHRALRRVAVAELAAHADVPTLRSVTDWLRDERVPYAPAAAEAVLARSGGRATALAAALVTDEGPAPGPLAWALGAVCQPPPWERLLRWLADPDPRVRRASAARVAEAAPGRAELFAVMGRLLEDRDDAVKCLAAAWLASTQSRAGRELLARVGPGQPTPVRCLVARAHEALGDEPGLRTLAADAHGGVRTEALLALARLGALGALERRELECDPDPWVRSALLTPESARRAVDDAALGVRRAAVALLDGPARRAWAQSPTAEQALDDWIERPDAISGSCDTFEGLSRVAP